MYDEKDNLLAAYLAGLYDGEGYFGIRTSRTQRNSARICITNTHLGILLFVKEELSRLGVSCGSVLESHRTEPGNRQRQYYLEINVAPKNIKRFCGILYPYAVIKHEHIMVLSRFCETRMLEGQFGNDYGDEQGMLYLRLKQLNHRGK